MLIMLKFLINVFVMNYLFYKLKQNVNKKTLMLQSFSEHKGFGIPKILQICEMNLQHLLTAHGIVSWKVLHGNFQRESFFMDSSG